MGTEEQDGTSCARSTFPGSTARCEYILNTRPKAHPLYVRLLPIAMGTASGTVMSFNLTDPPNFDPTKDLQEWRRNVCRLVDTISSAVKKGPNRRYLAIFATLGLQLYDRALPSTQKSVVEEAKKKGMVDYKQEDQMKAVCDIVELVAVDTPIAVFSRLISSFNRVTTCHRRKDELLASFVLRFRGLAADHLIHGGLSSSSQVREVLAITLLNNASLSEETLTNAQLQLISLAKARMRSRSYTGDTQHHIHLVKFQGSVNNLREMLPKPHFKILRHGNHNMTNVKLLIAKRKVNEAVVEFEGHLTDTCSNTSPTPSINKLLQPSRRCRLNLDDTVTVIRNLSFTPSSSAAHCTREDLGSIVGQKVQTALYAIFQSNQSVVTRLGSRKEGNESTVSFKPGNAKRKRTDVKAGKGGKSSFCFGCGDTEHIAGNDFGGCLGSYIVPKSLISDREEEA